MYRDKQEYERIIRLVIQVYLDYEISSFPIEEKKLCQKLNITLAPYSAYSTEEQNLLMKRSEYGFIVQAANLSAPIIFYNDMLRSHGAVRQTIFHEIKHFIDEDTEENPEDDDLAEFFGKNLACPIASLIWENIENPNEIVAKYGVSYQMAKYLSKNVKNRKRRYGNTIFDYEKPLIKQLYPTSYELFFKDGEAV